MSTNTITPVPSDGNKYQYVVVDATYQGQTTYYHMWITSKNNMFHVAVRVNGTESVKSYKTLSGAERYFKSRIGEMAIYFDSITATKVI